MNFIALIAALALTYYRPHKKIDWLYFAYVPVAQMLARNFDGGKNRHGVVAWMLGALLPAVLLGVAYFALLALNPVLGVLFGVVVLYLTLRFSYFSQRAERIAAALAGGNTEEARTLLTQWEPTLEASHFTPAEIAKVGVETTLRRAHQGLFGPILWFVLLGPGGALLYRLSHILAQTWEPQTDSRFHRFSHKAYEWLDWLPARVTAACFAVVGDFEDAVYCWRTQAGNWPEQGIGIILASGAGALGVKLGQPLPYLGVLQFRPELGLGDEADADYLRSAVGLVWRVLVLLVGLLFLLTFAHWLGN